MGRLRELEELESALGPGTLVTLVAEGGWGKTRLAVEAASNLSTDYAHGTYFVDLAPVTDSELVERRIVSVLGSAGRFDGSSMADHLHDRRLLLLLDRCEHLIDACRGLAETALRRGSSSAILATSRRPIGAAGEVVLRVPPLSLPPIETGWASFASASNSESVRLFVSRARRADPAFTLTRENVPAVATICRRLGGIPLALELAACQIRAMSPEQMSERIGENLRAELSLPTPPSYPASGRRRGR